MVISVDTDKMREAGNNVLVTQVDNRLVIVINTDVEIGLSSTGRMMGVGSTGKWATMPYGLVGKIYVGKKA